MGQAPPFGTVETRHNLRTACARMPKRQAADGEVFEGVAARYVHGEGAASEVAADLSDGIREMVAVNLLPGTVWSLRYTGHDFPTIDNVELLRAEPQFWILGAEKVNHLLADTSVRTAVEDGDGHFPAVYPRRQASRLSEPADLTAIFNECMLPGQLQHPTRLAYWGSWRTVLTWAVAHGDVKSLLPMSQDTLKAITQEALMVGLSAGTIRNLWSAIEDRHRQYGYDPPLAMRGGDFSRYSKAVASAKGMPSRLLFSYRGPSHWENAGAGGSYAHTDPQPDADHNWNSHVHVGQRAGPAPNLRRAVAFRWGVSPHVPQHICMSPV